MILYIVQIYIKYSTYARAKGFQWIYAIVNEKSRAVAGVLTCVVRVQSF